MDISEMLTQIRRAIQRCDANERELYEALVAEAEGWRMRLEELDEEDES
jgi:hypothetical protein